MPAPEPFISYAQNFEDIMLWRALQHVEGGFYIDAGAGEPETDSVTCAFYRRGWTGINIEPAPRPFALLNAARSSDINLNIAVGAVEGEAEFVVVDGGNGLSTLQPDRLPALQQEGWPLEVRPVGVRRLATICRDHVTRPIHFLKIDVEGSERAVLEGAELDTWRPWIIVVEATRPNSQESSYSAWEDLLLGVRYSMVYWDGLNRFYLAAEQAELASAFTAPPNVFDRFVRHTEWQASSAVLTLTEQMYRLGEELQGARGGLAALQAELHRCEEQRAAAAEQHAITLADGDRALQELQDSYRSLADVAAERQTRLDQLEAALHAVHESTSWRLTAPIRAVKRFTAGR